MFMSPEMARYFDQLNSFLHNQNQHIRQMDAKLQALIQDLDQFKGRMTEDLNQFKVKMNESPAIRNEYKFDLLKIEKLEGTLNIGINPNGSDSSIEEFAVGQSLEVPSLIEKQFPQLFPGIQQQINAYLSTDAHHSLKCLENKYNYPFNDSYRSFILENVKKQIDKQIRHYLHRIHPEQVNPEQLETIQQSVFEDVKRDIENTFETYVKNLLQKEKGS